MEILLQQIKLWLERDFNAFCTLKQLQYTHLMELEWSSSTWDGSPNKLKVEGQTVAQAK